MTLTRRFALLLAALLVFALAGSLLVHALAARNALQLQLDLHSQDAATALALSMSQQRGDLAAMQAVASAQVDLGHHLRVRLLGPQGQTLFDRSQSARDSGAPAWFEAALPLRASTGQAPVSNGWQPVGVLEVQGQAGWAHAALWAACTRTAALMAVLALAGLGLAAVLTRGWMRPLHAAVEQAQAIAQGRFIEAEEPRMPELRTLTRSMNRMASQLREVFERQAAQVAGLQRQAQTDAVTGLPVRQQFVARLADRLSDPAGAGTALLLVRLLSLHTVNERLGFDATDRLLAATAEVLQTYVEHVPGTVAGRLNGSDFGLVLPAAGVGQETAQSLHAALGASPLNRAAGLRFCVGGVDALQGQAASAALAMADAALARAEAGDHPVVLGAGDPQADAGGARAWRERMALALDRGLARLGEFPVVDRQGRLLHLECPLRLCATGTDDDYRPAHEWLAQATRAGLMPQIDLLALDLALQAIAADGRPRCVHVAQASLAAPGFVRTVDQRLAAAPEACRRLWLEWTDGGQRAPGAALRDAAAAWRARGVRLGVEHAGAAPQALAHWQATPVDYVKIDARHVVNAARDEAVRGYAASLVSLVHGLGLQALAEGISDAADLQALWQLGFDGATGSGVTAAVQGS